MKDLEIKRGQDVLNHLFDAIIHDDGFVCGGYARYCCSPASRPIESSDIDIYCPTDEAFARIRQRMAAQGYSLQFSSEVAETYRYVSKGPLPLQLIKPRIQGAIIAKGSIQDILNAFDFTIARCGIYQSPIAFDSVVSDVGVLAATGDDDFEEDEKHKRLVIKNIHCPIAQIYRVSKYLEKGYNITVLQVIKILEDWERRPSEYKRDIYDTLVKENPSTFEIQELEKLLHWD